MKTNFHTHSKYCDGKNTCREMIETAIENGFDAIGFSGHAYTDFDESYCMTKSGMLEYKNEIEALKREYDGKIRIYCGAEQDYYAPTLNFTPDYIIGSVHYVNKNGEYIEIDRNSRTQIDAVNKYYNGDFYAFAADYFSLVSDISAKTDCDIIGHFDLISKFNEKEHYFDEHDKRYIKAWQAAVDKLIPFGRVFEVNTGAIGRGYKTVPYPSIEMMEYIKENGGKVIITTDCHKAHLLDCGMDKAYELIEKTGIELVEPESLLKNNTVKL